jgi:hypothetical protein
MWEGTSQGQDACKAWHAVLRTGPAVGARHDRTDRLVSSVCAWRASGWLWLAPMAVVDQSVAEVSHGVAVGGHVSA